MVISKTGIIDLKLSVLLKDAVLRVAHEQICNSKCVVPLTMKPIYEYIHLYKKKTIFKIEKSSYYLVLSILFLFTIMFGRTIFSIFEIPLLGNPTGTKIHISDPSLYFTQKSGLFRRLYLFDAFHV